MTNKEFYNNKLIDIALDGKSLAVNKNTLEPCACEDLECCDCIGWCGKCAEKFKEWADSEYVEICPFEKDELVEVSHNGVDWVLRYFSNFKDGMYSTFADGTKSGITVTWTHCRKYGTLGGLEKDEFAEWFKKSNHYLCYNESIDDVLEEYKKRVYK